MFDFDMRDPCQDLENLSVSRFLRSQTEHRENCDVRLANVERRTQKLIMFEAVCLFRGSLRGANIATVIQCKMTRSRRVMMRIIMPVLHFIILKFIFITGV